MNYNRPSGNKKTKITKQCIYVLLKKKFNKYFNLFEVGEMYRLALNPPQDPIPLFRVCLNNQQLDN